MGQRARVLCAVVLLSSSVWAGCSDDATPAGDGGVRDGTTRDARAVDGPITTSDGRRPGDGPGVDGAPAQDATQVSCENGQLDGDETGLDCGGSCKACTAKTYFVANNGSDGAAGTSATTAWKTLAQVNKTKLQPGDAVLLRRGDRWYETLSVDGSGTQAAPIVCGAYGSGARPQIFGSKALTAFTKVTGNIWVSVETVTDPSLGANHDGSQKGSGGYPGGAWFERKDGSVVWGHQEKVIGGANDFGQLTQALDWGWYADKIYLYAAQDPTTLYAALQVSQRQSIIDTPGDHLVIDGLDLRYAQSKGVYDGYPARAARGLTVKNSRIGFIGIKGAAAAYGLAVWHSDLLVKNNEIHDCGRRSVSYNIYATRNVTFENITLDGNLFHHGYHTTGLDLSLSGSDTIQNVVVKNNRFEGDPSEDLGGPEGFNSNHIWTDVGPGTIQNFEVYNNTFTYAHGKALAITGIKHVRVSFNTFYGVNPTLANFQGQLYCSGAIEDVVVRNNIFYNDVDPAFNQYFVSVRVDQSRLAQLDLDYNLFYTTKPTAYIVFIVPTSGSSINYNTGKWAAYQSERGWDAHSPAPADPKFVNGPGGDLHLAAGSPAIGAGLAIPTIGTDLTGKARSTPPSLGAYAF